MDAVQRYIIKFFTRLLNSDSARSAWPVCYLYYKACTEVPEIDGNLAHSVQLTLNYEIAIYLWHLCTLYGVYGMQDNDM